jgi:biopolymer transport protein ExbB
LELLYRQYPPEPKIINTGRLSKRTSTNFDSSSQLESKTFIQDPENRPNEPIDNYDLNLVNSANLPDNKVDDANLNFGEKPEDES